MKKSKKKMSPKNFFRRKTQGNMLVLIVIFSTILLSFALGIVSFFQNTIKSSEKNFSSEKAYFSAESGMEIILGKLKNNDELSGKIEVENINGEKISAEISGFVKETKIHLDSFEVFLFPQSKCIENAENTQCEKIDPGKINISAPQIFRWKIRCENGKSLGGDSKNFRGAIEIGKNEKSEEKSVGIFLANQENCLFSFSGLENKISAKISAEKEIIPLYKRVLKSTAQSNSSVKNITFEKGQKQILPITEFGILHRNNEDSF